MSRPIGSTNAPKEKLNRMTCSKCDFKLITCIPLENIAVGHDCKNYNPKVKKGK